MKNKKFYSLISMFVVFILIFSGCSRKKDKKFVESEIVSPRKGDILVKVLATGTITPYRRIEIKSSERGRVEKIYFDEGDRIIKGQTLALISSLDRISLIDTARANLYKAKKSNDEELIKTAENELAIAEKAYNPVPQIAPVSGEIISRAIEPGEHVSMEKVLFVISDRLILRIQVDESDIGKIKLKQGIQFYLETFPDEKHIARVRRIAREGVIQQNVMQYEVLGFPDRVLRKWIAGMTVNAEFVISEKKNILLLPVDAVRTFKDKSFIIAVSNENNVVKKVNTGISDYKDIEILKGVNEKDKVLVLGQKDFEEFFRSLMKKKGGADLRKMRYIMGGSGKGDKNKRGGSRGKGKK